MIQHPTSDIHPIIQHPTPDIHKTSTTKPAKKLTIYTSTDDPAKKLKSATQILLTLTPVNQSQLFESQTPIAWKIIPFAPYCETVKFVDLHSGFAFSPISRSGHDVITADIGAIIQPRNKVVLQDVAGSLEWSPPITLHVPDEVIIARNECLVPKTFALCSVDDAMINFNPLVLFNKALAAEEEVETRPPVMLQAYPVSKYEEGQILGVDHQENFLFRDKEEAKPINISEYGKDTITFQVYSDHTGRVKINLL